MVVVPDIELWLVQLIRSRMYMISAINVLEEKWSLLYLTKKKREKSTIL